MEGGLVFGASMIRCRPKRRVPSIAHRPIHRRHRRWWPFLFESSSPPYLARTSLPAVYRAIDPPRASARSRYRPPPEEFVPSPFVVGRSTRTGTGNPSHEEAPSRVVPRELSGRHRPGRRIIPFPSTKIRIRVAFRTAAELSTILDDSLSGEFGKPGGRRRRATRQVHG